MACRHTILYYRAAGHICCGLQTQYLVYTGLEDIFVVACRHNSLYILGWRTYLLWPADRIPCIYWAGGHICCDLQTQYLLVYTGLEDIFVVACRQNTLYILGWRTYLLWPAQTIPCLNINIYLRCVQSSSG